MFWYCHKRGRDVRLAGEKTPVVDSEGRIVELPDDPQSEGSSSRQHRGHELRSSRDRNRIEDPVAMPSSSSRHSGGSHRHSPNEGSGSRSHRYSPTEGGSRRHSPRGSRHSRESRRSVREGEGRSERRERRERDVDDHVYERSDRVCYQDYD